MTALASLKALAEAATPGPWELTCTRERGDYVEGELRGMFGEHPATYPILNRDLGAIDCARVSISKDNAAYIAAASPPTVLALIRVAMAAKDLLEGDPTESLKPLVGLPTNAQLLRAALADLSALVEFERRT
jgi:hypothetical protein